jgi:hypothetical protein
MARGTKSDKKDMTSGTKRGREPEKLQPSKRTTSAQSDGDDFLTLVSSSLVDIL